MECKSPSVRMSGGRRMLLSHRTSESFGRWSTGENGYSGASDDGAAGHYGRIESLWSDGMGQSGK